MSDYPTWLREAMKTTLTEYHRLLCERQRIIRQNAGRRMSGKPALPVPAKPEQPLARLAFRDGEYVGRLTDGQDCPVGCTVRTEPAVW